MLRSAEVLETMRHGADYGVLADNIRLDWSPWSSARSGWSGPSPTAWPACWGPNGVTVVNGHARFVGPTEVEVVAVGEAPLGAGGPLYNAPPAPDGRARAGRLAGDEVGGGTFTVSNLGMFGVEQFTAVINPPEAAILAVGAALPEPVATRGGEVKVRRRMRLTLSVDHRALDGATAAGFLTQLKDALEHPLRIVA